MNTRPRIKKDLQLLKKDASKVLEDIAKINHNVFETGESKLGNYSSELQARFDQELTTLKSRLSMVEQSVSKQMKVVDKNVRRNPYAYIVGGMSLGFLTGNLFGRFKR